ncbi:acetate kinase [Waterburya agarophytonicola K14]|uniref:Acetate kinase n=1 Tax=Waterburya agarophytonicola KI4 TaxID=2874699 RepID=A0A964BQJ6_9CYAN|nr:acetate kinase [Waterburya agarophytonicola]MCC0177768.1 acetate kinase [Waterburya agarophytonicola KI4]
MFVLVLNAGSSSQKSCLYSLEESIPDTPPKPLWEAHLDWTVAQSGGVLTVKSNDIRQRIEVEKKESALQILLDTLTTGKTKVLESFNDINAVGHRVVHGGAKYSQATVIDDEVKKAIASLIPLAPSHNPANLEGIETIEKLLPEVPQVAVFDTAFHTTIPQAAKVYPLPYEYYQKGIQRYGFHGISHQYCSQRTAQILQQPLESLKIVTCHLGNGCSLAAIDKGICIDTTMGFSPLEGLMMGTRCGSIDPQIPIYLMQKYGLNVENVNHLLNQESGLLGVSGVSGDMRAICKAMSDNNEQAQLAFNIYLYRLKKAIGAMVASLNGLDVLVFTAGVGENSAIVREKTCGGLSYLGLQLDLDKNNANPVDKNIAAEDSMVKILVIHTQEDWAIAQMAFNWTI